MARIDQFREVILDFKGITSIGQAFADEVFRIYRRDHPGVNVSPVNMAPDVKGMIQRSLSGNPDDPLHEYLRSDMDKQRVM